MSKRRVFDIDFEDTSVPAGTEPPADPPATARRGPMASAISENADAMSARQATEAGIREENDRLAHEFMALKKNGQITGLIPVEEIRSDKLTRDRSATRDPELQELKDSIVAVGLSNPVRVEETRDGFELIQGFRRLSAYRELLAETGDATYARIPATLQARGEDLKKLYRRMVDENLVRRDISFAEMARLAMTYAGQRGMDVGEAVDRLYASAGRQKRAYIKSFTHLLDSVGDALKFPEVIPRSTGLALVRLLDANPRFSGQLCAVLNSQPGRDAATELNLLRGAVTGGTKKPKKSGAPAPKSTARTTIKLNRPEGVARCTASAGKFEVLLDHDFGAVDPRRLELAARAFLDQLKD